jgi:small multidrug resistance family-3 protein
VRPHDGRLADTMVDPAVDPDRFDIAGALICLVGVAVIVYAPRASS